MSVVCPRCGSDQLAANKRGWNVSKAVVGGLLLGPFGLALGAKDRNAVLVTCLACGNTWRAGHPNSFTRSNPKASPDVPQDEFPRELNGRRYRVEKDGTVSAIDTEGRGDQVR